MKAIRKILLMELWGIGDAVMMSAVLRPLRQAYPDAEICVLCQTHGREILRENREIGRFFVYKFPWTVFRGKYNLTQWDWRGLCRIITELHREHFDLVLDARGDPRNELLAFMIGARQRISRRKDRSVRHRLEHWGRLLQRVGVPYDELRPFVALSLEEKAAADRFLRDKFSGLPKLLVGIHPGAAQRVRCWPLARFQEVAARLNAQKIAVLILAEPEGYGSEIARALSLPHCRDGIRQLAALIARMDLLICNDTGVMHIAGAEGTPVVAVFGPGDPDFIGPRDAGDIIIRKCEHRPCFDTCRLGSPACLEDISTEDVWSAVQHRLEKKKGK